MYDPGMRQVNGQTYNYATSSAGEGFSPKSGPPGTVSYNGQQPTTSRYGTHGNNQSGWATELQKNWGIQPTQQQNQGSTRYTPEQLAESTRQYFSGPGKSHLQNGPQYHIQDTLGIQDFMRDPGNQYLGGTKGGVNDDNAWRDQQADPARWGLIQSWPPVDKPGGAGPRPGAGTVSGQPVRGTPGKPGSGGTSQITLWNPPTDINRSGSPMDFNALQGQVNSGQGYPSGGSFYGGRNPMQFAQGQWLASQGVTGRSVR